MGLARIGADGRLHAIARPKTPSQQAVFLYTGWMGRLFIDPLTFTRATGILDRNLVLFNDPDRTLYAFQEDDRNAVWAQVSQIVDATWGEDVVGA